MALAHIHWPVVVGHRLQNPVVRACRQALVVVLEVVAAAGMACVGDAGREPVDGLACRLEGHNKAVVVLHRPVALVVGDTAVGGAVVDGHGHGRRRRVDEAGMQLAVAPQWPCASYVVAAGSSVVAIEGFVRPCWRLGK